ncbi:uncharacterized protein LOC115886993 [Sitophilus oryzae]|uniref:Uncharacterized protein LOC115886993 n=1 Tax=Sitophilus oryzae TaxID=7048 RepID=A0A6J2YFI8_SITOR|nr:uncharacterized protein LOC115886993 [Sitophilus oryzae]
MNFNIFSAFCLILVVANVHSSSHLKDGVRNIVVQLLEEAFNELDLFFQEADEYIAKIENQEPEIEENIINYVISEGKLFNSYFVDLIKSFEANATADGKIVLQCIVNEKDQFESAFSDASQEIGKCIAAEFSKVTSQIRAVLKEFSGFKDGFRADVDSLEKCSGEDVFCLIRFGASVLDTVRNISPAIHNDIENLFDLFIVISEDVRKCAGNAFFGIRDNTQEIFNETVVCFRQ